MIELYDKEVLSIETDTTMYNIESPNIHEIKCMFSGDGRILYCLIHLKKQLVLINSDFIHKITFKK